MAKAKRIAVLACRVGKAPVVEHIDNDLKTLQKFVGGYIETVNLGGGIVGVVNDEGALKNLPVGFLLNGTRIHGDFFITRATPAGNFASLTNRQAMEFSQPYHLRWLDDPDPSIFYFGVRKFADRMSRDELEQECESAESYFNSCREIGQGINSKESIRYRDCMKRLEEQGVYRNYWN